MNISEITEALDNFATVEQSNFEFENFFLDNYPTKARQLIAVMLDMEKTHAELLDLKNELAIADKPGVKILLHRAVDSTDKKLSRLYEWYSAIPSQDRTSILENFENEEPEYWSHVLGRKTALEILSNQRTSNATMDAMTKLPVDDFEEAVRVCIKYTALIRHTSESVENSMEMSVLGNPQG